MLSRALLLGFTIKLLFFPSPHVIFKYLLSLLGVVKV